MGDGFGVWGGICVAAEEAEDFVAAGFGGDEELRGFAVWAGFDEVEERELEGGEAEVVVGFGDGFGDAAAVRTADAGGAVDVSLVGDAVLAGVGRKVDVAAVLEGLEEVLDALLVTEFGGADEVVVGDAHAVPQGVERGGDPVGELLRGDAGGVGGALDLLAVLVGAGEEEGVVAEQAMAPGEDVRDDGGIGVADVGARVDVVDRRGEIELVAAIGHFWVIDCQSSRGFGENRSGRRWWTGLRMDGFGVRYQVSGIGCQVSGVRYRVSGTSSRGGILR